MDRARIAGELEKRFRTQRLAALYERRPALPAPSGQHIYSFASANKNSPSPWLKAGSPEPALQWFCDGGNLPLPNAVVRRDRVMGTSTPEP